MKQQLKKILIILITVYLAILVGACMSEPGSLGVSNGQLSPCPESPNCVCSQLPKSETTHYIDPISYEFSEVEIKEKITSVIKEYPRTKIISDEGNYLHVEFKTMIFRFVDDLEILIDDSSKLVHFRSASRIGYSDLGTNRKRVEALKARIQSKLK